jgi:hypothetical protein
LVSLDDHFPMTETPLETPFAHGADDWRQTHLGRLLGHAMRRFDERVLTLMAHDVDVPLALSNLAARAQISAAHVHITRHLDRGGSRLTELAERAGMTKQAMGTLVDQCEAWGLVAVAQAEAEFRASVGDDIAMVVTIGLEAYAS